MIMKTKLSLLFLLLPLLCFGQPILRNQFTTNGAHGTVTLDNQYTYAPVTVTTTDEVNYAGVYSYAGVDAYGNQYATNSGGYQLKFDSASSYGGEAYLLAQPGGTVEWYYAGASEWRYAPDYPSGVVSDISTSLADASVVTTFRTLVSTGMVQLPDMEWDGAATGGTLTLNNGYTRYTFTDAGGLFAITDISNLASGKPKWTSFKMFNNSGVELTFTMDKTPAVAIGTIVTAIPDQKVLWMTIHDDGQGTDASLTYATVLQSN